MAIEQGGPGKPVWAVDNDPVWLTRTQLHENLSNLQPAALGNTINALIAITLFADDVARYWLALGFLLLVGLLAWRREVAQRFLADSSTPQMVRWAKLQVHWLAAALGGLWGGSLGLLFLVADPAQQMFLGVLAAGMMNAGTATFRTRPMAARVYLLMLVPGLVVAFLSVGSASGLATLGLLACYLAFLNSQIKLASARFNRSAQRERDLEQSNETIALLLNDFTEQGSDWLIELDKNGHVRNPSERLLEVCERPRQMLEGKPMLDILDAGPDRNELGRLLATGRPFRHQIVSLTIDGVQHWWTVSARPVNGGIWRGVCTDITAQRHAEEKVSYMAHYDGLTDLPNRFMFSESLYHALNRDQGQAGLMCIDLDNFKVINDTLGHQVGDLLLRAVARRLESCVADSELIARLGGDEFAILVSASAMDRIDEMAQTIVEQLAIPFALGDHDVVIGTSIGIACAPDNGTDADRLMRNADLALYSAKSLGRNRSVRFEAGMDAAAQSRRLIEMDLRSALGKGEFQLHYQALVDASNRQVSGYEALIRWEHPVRGTVMPDLFIPIAEETGLIIQIGEWVIRKAVDDLTRWEEHVSVSINLSPAQMRSPALISTLANAIGRSGVDPSRICLEITETVLMQDTEVNIETLHALRGLGVQVALDDFGTGYSSLNYLRSFPFSKIKIDRCFIAEIDNREDCQAIVKSVVSLASSLGMRTTAEGVEREEQLQLLKDQGCDEVQGFLFSKAVALEELSNLRKPNPRPASGAVGMADKSQPILLPHVGNLPKASRAA